MIKRLEIQQDGIVKLFSFDQSIGELTCSIIDSHLLDSDDIESLLKRKGLVSEGDRFIYNTPIIGSYSAPFKVYIDITDSCQLNCRHCLTKQLNKNNELSFLKMKEIADECNRLGVFYVKFGGGEPLLHCNFKETITYYRSKGLFLSLSTNGFLIDELMADFLAENQIKTTISIEGPENIDSIIRGKGHFQRALKALECLQRHHVDVALRVTFTRYMLDIELWDDLVKLAGSYNVKLKVAYCRPSGAALDNNCMIKYSDKEKYITVIKYLNNELRCGRVSLDEGMMEEQPKSLDWMLYEKRVCGSANRSMHINSKGQIATCVFMGANFTEMDSCYQLGDIEAYWTEKKGTVFRKVRDIKMPNECHACIRKCKYECLATRLYASGSFSGEDPNCLREVL